MKRKNKFLIIAFALVVFLSLGVRNVNANESVIKAEAVKDMYYVTDHFDEDPDYEDYSYKLIYDFDIRGNVVLDADEELCNYLGIEPKDGKCITKTTASYEGGGYITKIKINGVDINDGKIDPYNYDGDEYEDENIFDHTDYIYYYGTGEDIEIADGVIVNRTFKKVNNKILVTYKLTNNSGKKITYDLGIATDTYFLKNDRAALFIEDNKKGITITQDNKDSSDYLGYGAQFFINFDSPVTTAWLGDYCNNDDTYYYEHSFDNSDVNHISNIDGAATWSWHDTILDGESSEKTVSFGSSITYERKIKYKDPETGDEIEEDSLIGGAFELPDLGEIDTVPAGYRQAWMQKRGDEITELDSNIAIVPDNPDTEVLYYTDIIPIKYKIHFNTNGGERIDTIFYTLNDIINLPEAKKIGYKFTGWKVIETDNEEKWTVGSTLNGTLSNSFMGDVTLKAQYEYKEYVLTIHDVIMD